MMLSDDQTVQTQVKSILTGFREAFDLFDIEGDGGISDKDFLKRWHQFGFEATDEQVEALIRVGDVSNSGELEFEEFARMLSSANNTDLTSQVKKLSLTLTLTLTLTLSMTPQVRNQLTEIREVFSIFDPDGDGTITSEEVYSILIVICTLTLTLTLTLIAGL